MKNIFFSITAIILFFTQNQAQMVYNVASMPEAKFYYSNKPFTSSHEGAKTSFHSNEFIYGRLELENKNLKEAFQLSNIKNGSPFLYYQVASYKNEKQTGNTNSIWRALKLKENDLNNNWLNFDILPDPALAVSSLGLIDENGSGDFNKVDAAPLYAIIQRENFPEDAEYTVYVQFYMQIRDGWGNRVDDSKWPLAEGSFTFRFSGNDVTTLQQNRQKAGEKLNISYVDKLPDYFTNPVKISEPAVTVAKVTPLIKNYLGAGYEVLKVAIEPAGSMWSIVKNDLGIITYRYVTGYYRIVYKNDGKCQLGSVRILQDYIEGGKYGNLYCKFWGDEGVIDCSKVK